MVAWSPGAILAVAAMAAGRPWRPCGADRDRRVPQGKVTGKPMGLKTGGDFSELRTELWDVREKVGKGIGISCHRFGQFPWDGGNRSWNWRSNLAWQLCDEEGTNFVLKNGLEDDSSTMLKLLKDEHSDESTNIWSWAFGTFGFGPRVAAAALQRTTQQGHWRLRWMKRSSLACSICQSLRVQVSTVLEVSEVLNEDGLYSNRFLLAAPNKWNFQLSICFCACLIKFTFYGSIFLGGWLYIKKTWWCCFTLCFCHVFQSSKPHKPKPELHVAGTHARHPHWLATHRVAWVTWRSSGDSWTGSHLKRVWTATELGICRKNPVGDVNEWYDLIVSLLSMEQLKTGTLLVLDY